MGATIWLRGLAAATVLSALSACAGPGVTREPIPDPVRDRARSVVTVTFRSRFPAAEVRRRYPTRMDDFRALPGLIQKYYLYDPASQQWSGIYFWESRDAVAAYLRSDLRASIPVAYGVVGEPRVASFEIVDALR